MGWLVSSARPHMVFISHQVRNCYFWIDWEFIVVHISFNWQGGRNLGINMAWPRSCNVKWQNRMQISCGARFSLCIGVNWFEQLDWVSRIESGRYNLYFHSAPPTSLSPLHREMVGFFNKWKTLGDKCKSLHLYSNDTILKFNLEKTVPRKKTNIQVKIVPRR